METNPTPMSNLRKIILAVMAMIITAGFLWFNHREIVPPEVNWQTVQLEAQQGGYQIIDTDALWDRYRLNPESLLLVDTRQEWEYDIGHIDGAENFPMESTWLSRWRKKGALETSLGPDKERFIVFY
jgi:rhodanese-related sulfurtransferase